MIDGRWISLRDRRRFAAYATSVPYEPLPEEIDFYRRMGGPEKTEWWHGEGCNFCFRTGFEDRIGVYELVNTSAADSFIVPPAPNPSAPGKK